MNTTVQFRLVDAFASGPYTGNPAGVVLDADALSDAHMQLIAREINASETAFITRGNDLHEPTRLRWFSPTTEVDFCGHATLAAVHALSEVGCIDVGLSDSQRGVSFESAAGTLQLYSEAIDSERRQLIWWLRMPEPRLRPASVNVKKLCDALALPEVDLESSVPLTRTRDDDLIVFVQSYQQLLDLRPNFQMLARWSEVNKIRGVCVSTLNTLTPTTHVHSRFFAPAVGIPEDPVTGSVHGPLAALLVANGLAPFTRQRAALNCVQGEPGGRTGLVRVLIEQRESGCDLAIAGECFTTLHGELTVPEA